MCGWSAVAAPVVVAARLVLMCCLVLTGCGGWFEHARCLCLAGAKVTPGVDQLITAQQQQIAVLQEQVVAQQHVTE